MNLVLLNTQKNGCPAIFHAMPCFKVYFTFTGDWLFMKSFSSLASAKKYALRYCEKHFSCENEFVKPIPDIKISKFMYLYGPSVKDYYFIVK